MLLPPHATEASHRLYELAVRLAQSCPPELGDEIALTGSTARGLADDDSDLELNLWSETVPSVAVRVAWLKAAGVGEIEVFEQPRTDNSYWIDGKLGDVLLEVGWQTYEACENNIQKMLIGDMSGMLAYLLINACPLRTNGRLEQCQEELRGYSDKVQAMMVQSALGRWSTPDHFKPLLKLARRGERLAHTGNVLSELNAVMSLLYAINRQWEPSRKWTLSVAHELPRMPDRWRERIDDVLSAPPPESVYFCAELLLDALAFVPPEYDVSAAVAALREATKR
jgi:hypothetical protein